MDGPLGPAPGGKRLAVRGVEGLTMRPFRHVQPRSTRPARRAAALPALLAVASLLGCSSDDTEQRPFMSPEGAHRLQPDETPPITTGAISRAKTAQLEEDLQAIMRTTLGEMNALTTDLESVVGRLTPPPRLATTDPILKGWREDLRESYQVTVDGLYAEASRRLKGLEEAAYAAGLQRAMSQATPASPLDAGRTGDPAIDSSLETFDEVVRDSIGQLDLSDRQGHDRRRRLDLFEVFSSFGSAGAEAAMGGRILLFVGGDETNGVPMALLAFRCDDGSDPRSRNFGQVFRHRVMRGPTVVKDLGWRLAPVASGAPGRPHTETLDVFVLAPDCQPVVDRSSPHFDELRDMRILVDVQSAVFDAAGKLLGGVDWRLEYKVSSTGDLTWQLSGGKPVHDPYCAEVLKLLPGASPATASPAAPPEPAPAAAQDKSSS
jgi:hypothetical protein